MFRDFEKYEVYEDGRIWSYKRKKFLKPQKNESGYYRVSLYDNDNNKKSYFVHRVVYEAVTRSQIQPGMDVNHIDSNPSNNSFSNLNLLTHTENINFGTRTELAAQANTNHPNMSKRVGAFQNGELKMVFPSISEAQRHNYNLGGIWSCCNGKIKQYKGFQWRYLDN